MAPILRVRHDLGYSTSKLNTMAELHVQRKPHGAVWIWLFLILLILAVGAYLYVHYYQKDRIENTGRPRSSQESRPLATMRA